MQRAQWLSEEALQVAEKRREAKGKREKERHTHLNEEFQRIARTDKKAFLSDQCREIEGNNRNLIKKIRDTKDGLNEHEFEQSLRDSDQDHSQEKEMQKCKMVV